MDILSKTDDEIYELAKPLWDNLVKSSNLKPANETEPFNKSELIFILGTDEIALFRVRNIFLGWRFW